MNVWRLHLIGKLIFFTLLLSLAACGGGSSSSGPAPAATDLTALSISGTTLDQTFQSNLYSYTATAGYLMDSIKISATPATVGATITINGVALGANNISQSITLVEGTNPVINIVISVTGFTDQTYQIITTRQSAASFAQRAYLKASNTEAIDQFGISVALDGDTLVVGAFEESGDANSSAAKPNNNAGTAGAVYVFVRSNGRWTQQSYLKASNAEALDQFGISVALDGDTLVVGANEESGDANSTAASPNNNAGSAGAAYVFLRTGTKWKQQAYLKASNADALDQFGISVTLDGETLVVGAVEESGDANSTAINPNDNAGTAGAAYVFLRTGTKWKQQAYLKASNAGALDQFGISVALDGNTLAVGAAEESGDASSTAINPNDNADFAGAAYVFLRTGTNWEQQAYLKANNAESFDKFGISVALNGNTLAVGASEEAGDANSTAANPNNNADFAGAAYVFIRNGTNWNQQAYLKASNAESIDKFGFRIALDGDTLVIAAIDEAGDANSSTANPNNNAEPAGAAYLFERSGSNWTQRFYLKASNAEAFDQFSMSLALDGGTLAIGASKESGDVNSTTANPNNNAGDAGAIYIFQ